MGSISSEDCGAISCLKERESEARCDGTVYEFATVRMDGLSTDELCLASGAREEIILLSWLLVLLRIQDSDGVSFEWAYGNKADDDRTVERHHFAANEFIGDLEASTEQCSIAIAAHLGHLESKHMRSGAHSSSLLLSTGSLLKQSDKIQEEARESPADILLR